MAIMVCTSTYQMFKVLCPPRQYVNKRKLSLLTFLEEEVSTSSMQVGAEKSTWALLLLCVDTLFQPNVQGVPP